MTSAPLTRHIGTTERTLQALLNRRLSAANISFPEWTALVFISSGASSAADLTDRMVAGAVVPREAVADVVAALRRRDLVSADGPLALTEAGRATYATLRAEVDRNVSDLMTGLPEADVEATRRTLDALRDRAAALLAA